MTMCRRKEGREGAGEEKGRRERRNLPTTNWHLTATSTRNKLSAAAAADIQYPLKGIYSGEQKWGTLCSWKNWKDRSSDS